MAQCSTSVFYVGLSLQVDSKTLDLIPSQIGLGQLAAARALAKRVPFSSISFEKTGHLLGRRVDVSMDSDNSEEDEGADFSGSRMTRLRQQQYEKQRQRHSSHRRTKAGREVLRKQARTYRELETLVFALNALDGWREIADRQKT